MSYVADALCSSFQHYSAPVWSCSWLTMLIPGDRRSCAWGLRHCGATPESAIERDWDSPSRPMSASTLPWGPPAGAIWGAHGHWHLVLDDLWARLPMSIELGVCSMLLAIAIGIPVGVWGAAGKDSVVDYSARLMDAWRGHAPLLGWLMLVYVFYFKARDRSGPTAGSTCWYRPQGYHRSYLLDSVLAESGGIHVERRPISCFRSSRWRLSRGPQ